MSKTLFVRIHPKQKGVTRFFRCGFEFVQAWTLVSDLDDATAQRLEEEQMLEVSESAPDAEEQQPEAGDSAPVSDSQSGAVTTPPADAPAETSVEAQEAVQEAAPAPSKKAGK